MTQVLSRRSTDYLSAGGFLNKIAGLSPGQSLTYATGDLAHDAPLYPDLHMLRAAAWRLYEEKKIALTQRVCPERGFIRGGRAFEYIATKRSEEQKKERA